MGYIIIGLLFLITSVQPKHISLQEKINPNSCNEDQDCKLKHSICEDGVCTCEPLTTVFDSNTETCLKKVKFDCNFDKDCVPNAFCKEDISNNQFCVCEDDFIDNIEGSCSRLLNFNDTCEVESVSAYIPGNLKFKSTCGTPRSEIDCIAGRCQCRFNEENQYYDNVLNKCISYEGKDCSASCTDNSACLDTFQRDKDGNITYPFVTLGLKCVCLPGFTRNPMNQECMLEENNTTPITIQTFNEDEFDILNSELEII